MPEPFEPTLAEIAEESRKIREEGFIPARRPSDRDQRELVKPWPKWKQEGRHEPEYSIPVVRVAEIKAHLVRI